MQRIPTLPSALILSSLVLLTACGDPLRITASEPVISTRLILYPFSHVPPTYPAAINTPFAVPVPVTANANFDVALDLDSEGRIVVMTPRAVVTPLTGHRRIGLWHAGGSFESLTEVPPGAPFQYDSLLTIIPGEVAVVEANRGQVGDICGFAISPNIYSKLRVVSINPETLAMTVDFTVDPNCGFRSFEPGIPTN
jgi:hypothetical protein